MKRGRKRQPCDRQPDETGGERDQHAFDEEVPRESETSDAQAEANGDLGSTRHAAGEQHPGEIDAGDEQQDGPDGGERCRDPWNVHDVCPLEWQRHSRCGDRVECLTWGHRLLRPAQDLAGGGLDRRPGLRQCLAGSQPANRHHRPLIEPHAVGPRRAQVREARLDQQPVPRRLPGAARTFERRRHDADDRVVTPGRVRP
jgi:hypothetical protein